MTPESRSLLQLLLGHVEGATSARELYGRRCRPPHMELDGNGTYRCRGHIGRNWSSSDDRPENQDRRG